MYFLSQAPNVQFLINNLYKQSLSQGCDVQSLLACTNLPLSCYFLNLTLIWIQTIRDLKVNIINVDHTIKGNLLINCVDILTFVLLRIQINEVMEYFSKNS